MCKIGATGSQTRQKRNFSRDLGGVKTFSMPNRMRGDMDLASKFARISAKIWEVKFIAKAMESIRVAPSHLAFRLTGIERNQL